MEIQVPIEFYWNIGESLLDESQFPYLLNSEFFHFSFSSEEEMRKQPLLSGMALIVKSCYSLIEHNLTEY